MKASHLLLNIFAQSRRVRFRRRRWLLAALLLLPLGGRGGDLLRGGAAFAPGSARQSYNVSGPAAAEAARRNAADELAGASRMLQALRSMESAARAAAVKAAGNNAGANPNQQGHASSNLSSVPNGLGIGGLQAASGATAGSALWKGASLPTQEVSHGITDVTIKQTSQQAVLNWTTFNVGSHTHLDFDQSAGGKNVGSWIAYNLVSDPSGVPSQILGAITAPGQVYVINQNGIIFGAGSQVNVHTLVASSLPINTNLIDRGILGSSDIQFLFSNIGLPAGANGTPSFNPNAPSTPGGRDGAVTVLAGASITAPASADKVGGRVVLVGPDVTNSGIISTPDGQVILAAGDQAGFTAHASGDASLRGLDAYIGAVAAGEGVATNSGLIEGTGADITIAGRDVRQLGGIESLTTVSLNGRVDLLANYGAVVNANYNSGNASSGAQFLNVSTGVVTLGASSVIQILPDWASAATVTGNALPLQSRVNMQGLAIHLAGGAQVFAPNADASLNAGTWNFALGNGEPATSFIHSGGQIYLDSGAAIDVAGSSDISAPVAQNILSLQLRGAELANSPVQRGGPVSAVTLNIDSRATGVWDGYAWVGTPLGDVSGYAALIERTAGELTTAGGSVTLSAGKSVILRAGSKIDVSGGWINYQGGIVQTSKLISGGRVVDISNATPDQLYSGIYQGTYTVADPNYGLSATYQSPLALTNAHYEDTYISGGAGGSIMITAPSLALDGRLLGATVNGPRQRSLPARPASLSIQLQAEAVAGASSQPYSPTPPHIIFANVPSQHAPADFALDGNGNPLPLRADRVATVELSTTLLTSDGFGSLAIQNNDGDITVPDGVSLTAAPGGSVSLSAANIDIEGAVIAHDGNLAFATYNLSPFAAYSATPAPNAGRGIFTLGAAAILDASGLTVDDRLREGSPPLLVAGGGVSINAYTADLLAGSRIDASGGAAVSPQGKVSYGAGGVISIKAGQDPALKSLVGGELDLASSLSAYSGGEGGSLAIQAPLVQIGGVATSPDTLLLEAGFFRRGGFTSYNIVGLGEAGPGSGVYRPGILIAPGAIIDPLAENRIIVPYQNGTLGSQTLLLPEGSRPAVSLSLDAAGVRDPLSASPLVVRGDFYMGTGSVIRTDPLGRVAIAGDTVAIMGSILAPGGSISVGGGLNSSSLFGGASGAVTTVDLGPQSILSTAGVMLPTPNAYGYHTGRVLDGGVISVSGNILAEAGAVLDVSGASDIADVPVAQLSPTAPAGASLAGAPGGIAQSAFLYASNGGSIIMAGGQQLFTGATLRGAAGGAAASGGSLQISSGRFYSAGEIPVPSDANLLVTQQGKAIAASRSGANHTAIGEAVGGASGGAIAGMGYFGVNEYAGGGFSALTLGGVVEFSGPVSITASRGLDIATGGVIYANAAVTLAAPLVALGKAFRPPAQAGEAQPPFTDISGLPYFFRPAYGAGSLSVRAGTIEIGNLSLQGIGNASFTANGGDIIGDGTLDVAGNITMRAGQIYPPTEVAFTIAASDYIVGGVSHAGTVSIFSSGLRDLPLSAGGTLSIYAANITQGGTLRAPFGTIDLGWNGSGAAPLDAITGQAVQAAGSVTLLAHSVTSVSAVDPATGQGIVIPYGINLNGSEWIDPAGSNITSQGAPGKNITISGVNVLAKPGSVIDLRGGGDLYAYRWVPGNGGARDVLASAGSFAVIPGFAGNYAPYAAYNGATDAANLIGTDPGYVNIALGAGERVYLGAGSGLPAGYYTLLPARYALLPGAFLVTPRSGTPGAAVAEADGASIVAGYGFDSRDGAKSDGGLFTPFEVAPAAVVRQRAQYDDYFAGAILRAGVPAGESGHLILAAAQTMSIRGSVEARAINSGAGGLIDISSPGAIVVGAAGGTASAGALLLDAHELDSFDARSLLIGGVRTVGANGATVTVAAASVTVDNAGSPLTGQDIILAANDGVTVASGAAVRQTGGASSGAEKLLLGASATPGSGDGALIRVSSDPNAQILRAGVDSSSAPLLTVGSGATISGRGVILDTTAAASLSAAAVVRAGSVSLDSGQVSILLGSPGAVLPTSGLVLSGAALQSLQGSARAISLLSYSSIDLYGSGQIGGAGAGHGELQSLALHAGEIRGFPSSAAGVQLSARTVLLDNAASAQSPGAMAGGEGTLAINAGVLQIGSGKVALDQFTSVRLNASGGVIGTASGSLAAGGGLTISAPLVTAAKGVSQGISAAGDLALQNPGGSATIRGGLGASLSLSGASVEENTNITLSSGHVAVEATAGDVTIGNASAATISVAGVSQAFFDATRYTSGGAVKIASDAGSVTVGLHGIVDAGAQAGGGSAGSIAIAASQGLFSAAAGSLRAANGAGGAFSLYARSLPSLAAIDALLNAGNFTLSRTYRAAAGDVAIDGPAIAATYIVSADAGSISVGSAGVVDASGKTGGAISLIASGGVVLNDGSRLTVAAKDFNSAGKGGNVTLEAGVEVSGAQDPSASVDIRAGSSIDLSVAAANASSAAAGDFTGTLHIRAPRVAASGDVRVDAIDGTITGASGILVEGVKLYSPVGGAITGGLEQTVDADATAFLGSAGVTTAGYTAMMSRLLGDNGGLASVTSIEAGAEIINPTGDLTLAANWDLSSFRYGPNFSAGDLTLRAAGNLVFGFKASLSDGFGGPSTYGLWDAPLLPAGSTSWSYRLVAGADISGADYRDLQPLPSVGPSSGSMLLGQGSPALPTSGNLSQRLSIIPSYYQAIRTGAGDISIYAARDVQLLNPVATIYTAGSQASPLNNFDSPQSSPVNSTLGASQAPNYPAQYSLGGGNVTISAQNDIAHYIASHGALLPDSSKEMPTSWLYRRGWVDPATGQFGQVQAGGDVASTTWWIDYSNFFEGIGALGGGNVTLAAGRDIHNVDVVVPTNARMPAGTPDAGKLVELGGGDLAVTAGRNLDGGVYYVERGHGTISAGSDILTNSTRAALSVSANATFGGADSAAWLPTTLFLGKGSMDLSAGGDALLGPVANPFLLPEGIGNGFLNKTYFSTYAAGDAVNITSLGGNVTVRSCADGGAGSLQAWYQNLFLTYQNAGSLAAKSEPWLRLDETTVSGFGAGFSLMPATLRAAAFSGDVNIVGGVTLSPAQEGTVDLVAAGSINGLQVNNYLPDTGGNVWATGVINLSDANPAAIPGVAAPLSFSAPAAQVSWIITDKTLFNNLSLMFNESGSYELAHGSIQARDALHTSGLLHAGDPNPVHLYAQGGDISGLTLYSGKFSRVIAGRDLSDLSLYLQNTSARDVSVVSAGRDITLYDDASALRRDARMPGNSLLIYQPNTSGPGAGAPTAGDAQINGPGTLEVLAGRNLDLGAGGNNADGTGLGIISVGNARDPYLPFEGASVIAAAGLFGPSGINSAQAQFATFIQDFVQGAGGARYRAELGNIPGLTDVAFDKLTQEQKDQLALDTFYLVLRDAGRDHNMAGSPGYGTYIAGFQAIAALFPGTALAGGIFSESRDIQTDSGGDISLLVPGGGLTMSPDAVAQTLAPPGIITQDGGNISIFAQGSVNIGVSRIFTLRGGNEIIWSSAGDIAAGNSAKTVQTAPPTRVLVDPQSANVQTDLAGLATGGGIGVLATVQGVQPGSVDLIAPVGVINAGDAGIRATGNLNIAAVRVLNASNIQAGGATSGVPVTIAPAAPNLASIAASAGASGALSAAVHTLASQNPSSPVDSAPPSIIDVQILGYGGDESE